MNHIESFLFGIYPYICATIFVGGCIYRYEREQFTWQASSSQMLRKRGFSWASNLFHLGVLGLAGGHVVGLLLPASVFHTLGIPDSAHQWMELIGGSLCGTATMVGLGVLTYRRIADERIRATGSVGDLLIGLLLMATLLVGMATLPFSWETRSDGMYLHRLASWAQHVVTFRAGAVGFLEGVPWMYKFHMFAGMTVFLIFPFTRLVHVCSAPLTYALRGYTQIVRPMRGRTVEQGEQA